MIELTDGVFTGAGNRDIDYAGKAVTIRSQSGDPAACIIDCETSLNAPHRGFLFQSSETAASVLSGVTITNGGNVDWFDPLGYAGGAIYCQDASPAIVNCWLIGNGAHAGGGIYSSGGSPQIVDCKIESNSATHALGGGGGGGILCAGGAPIIRSCTVVLNSTGANFVGHGAGIHIDHSAAVVEDCVVAGNFGDGSGGGIACSFSDLEVVISRCVVSGNMAYWQGGGLSARGPVRIEHSTLAGNFSAGIDGGGGVAVRQAHVENTIVWNNCTHDGVANQISVSDAVTLECSAVDPNGVAGPGTVTYMGDNVFTDPLFCAPAQCSDQGGTTEGDYSIGESSPCAPANSPGTCGLIGALSAGCTSTVEHATWGEIKGRYRTR